MLVDSHCHVDMPDFDADRDAVLARAREAGVARVLLIGELDGEDAIERSLRVAAAHALPMSAGMHPHHARFWSAAAADRLRDLARERRIVALGEVGLDFHYDHSPRDDQRAAFRQQVRLARDVGLPLIVHTREADEETATVLEQEGAGEVGGVIHCFTGGPELAERAVALGFHVSFSGIVTFPKAEGLRAVARDLPEERLLIETDAPFLAPPPHRGKRNEPAFVVEVARVLAGVRDTSPEALGAVALRNFEALFGLGGSGGAADARV